MVSAKAEGEKAATWTAKCAEQKQQYLSRRSAMAVPKQWDNSGEAAIVSLVDLFRTLNNVLSNIEQYEAMSQCWKQWATILNNILNNVSNNIEQYYHNIVDSIQQYSQIL